MNLSDKMKEHVMFHNMLVDACESIYRINYHNFGLLLAEVEQEYGQEIRMQLYRKLSKYYESPFNCDIVIMGTDDPTEARIQWDHKGVEFHGADQYEDGSRETVLGFVSYEDIELYLNEDIDYETVIKQKMRKIFESIVQVLIKEKEEKNKLEESEEYQKAKKQISELMKQYDIKKEEL